MYIRSSYKCHIFSGHWATQWHLLYWHSISQVSHRWFGNMIKLNSYYEICMIEIPCCNLQLAPWVYEWGAWALYYSAVVLVCITHSQSWPFNHRVGRQYQLNNGTHYGHTQHLHHWDGWIDRERRSESCFNMKTDFRGSKYHPIFIIRTP